MTTTASPHAAINTLTPNCHADGIYSLINPQVGTTRAGKPFLKCILRDATGEVVARQWSFDEAAFNDVTVTGFVWVTGHTQLYNQQVQFIIEQIKSVEVSDEEIARLLPTTRFNIDEMYAELSAMMNTLDHPAMLALAKAYLDDEELMGKFKRAPAAMALHHAWIGGLLEHTLQLLKLAEVMMPLYHGRLNRDLILMGLFLHDLSKTVELTWDQAFNYTIDGNLIGHVIRGAILLQFKAAVAAKQSGQKLSTEALRVLQHIIISHHGEYEYGAAKLPATPEAIFISHLDDLDAKTSMSLEAARPIEASAVDTGDMTDKIWALKNVRLYKPDPLKGE